ncbi:hypothetical protein [Streptacidiphilus melanogenes]|uniref:hypothetical protein n=1 Tax=Streptacidiphilus melanogenes TaxID=411235 RepID=UPI001F1FEE1D|nr:hypothetical protein [Streptacidiphilus melanogenes]
MDEQPIEELTPEWIDAAVEVVTPDGSTVGFRLSRYEKTTRDGEPLWMLFSTEQPWRIEVGAGAVLRRTPKPAGMPGPAGGFGPAPVVSPAPVTAPAAPTPAPLSPQSWVIAPPAEQR